MDFEEFRAKVMVLSENSDNVRAAELLRENQQRFPDHSYMMSLWRMQALSLAGCLTEALMVLQDSLEQGLWYPSEYLKSDTNLSSLQELPEFDRLLSICDERQTIAQQNVVHQHRLIRSETEPSDRLLVAMHGNYSNVDSHTKYWGSAAKFQYDILLPQSTQIVAPDRYIWNDRDKGFEDVLFHVNEVRSEKKLPSNVVLGGFSAGAGLALWMSLTGVIEAAGFIAIAPAMVDIDELRTAFENYVPSQIRGYIVTGKNDSYLQLTNELVALLNEYSISCKVEVHDDLGHEYPNDFEQFINKALTFISNEGANVI